MENSNEIWKDVVGYEGLYQVSNLGNAKALNFKNKRGFNAILKNDICKGYHQITIYKNRKGNRFKVHRLVAFAFIPNPNNFPQINHKDGNKENNDVVNLEWCTNSHNQKHAYLLGLNKARKGADRPNAKTTESQVKDIRAEYELGILNQRQIAKKFGMNYKLIFKIVRRKSWTHI